MSRPRRPRAWALTATVTLMLTLATMVVAAVGALELERATARRSDATAAARVVGLGGADELWARLLEDPRLVDRLAAGELDHPAVGTDGGAGFDHWRWARLEGGTPVACVTAAGAPDLTHDCYHVDIDGVDATGGTGVRGAAGDVGFAVRSVALTVTTRTSCSGRARDCVYRAFVVRLRERRYFDYLYFTQYNTLDPALYPAQTTTGYNRAAARANCADRYARPTGTTPGRGPGCVSVAYQGESDVDGRRDVVVGPVYTADDWINTCGNPYFGGTVSVVGGNGGLPHRPVPTDMDPGCAASDPEFAGDPGYVVGAARLTLPAATTAAATFHALAPPEYRLIAAEGATVTLTLRIVGNETFVDVAGTTNGQDRSGPAALRLPRSGVIYVGGAAGQPVHARISGEMVGKLSVYATGDLTIAGDLRYGDFTPADPDRTDSVLGLTAGGAVVIAPAEAGTTRTVHAVLLSVERAVFTQGWDTPTFAPGTAPRLAFFGAIAGKYQPVLGGYDAVSGQLVAGYRKDLTWDRRFAEELLQPPYLLSTNQSRWDRLDVSEVPPRTGRRAN